MKKRSCDHYGRQYHHIDYGGDPVSSWAPARCAGFAITLGFGVITSVFTAIFVTRLMVVIWFEARRPKTIEVHLRLQTAQARKLNTSISSTTGNPLASCGCACWHDDGHRLCLLHDHQGLNFGIDFRGGITIRTESPLPGRRIGTIAQRHESTGSGRYDHSKFWINPAKISLTSAMIHAFRRRTTKKRCQWNHRGGSDPR